MMMKWIAPSPVDELGIRIDNFTTIIVHGSPGVEQHICNTGYWNRKPCWIPSLGQRCPIETLVIRANKGLCAVAEPEPASRRSDLPKHGGQRAQHPVRLLTVISALQGPRCC